MSVSPAVPVSAEPAAGLSQVERVVDTFIAPSKTITDILRSTSWWLPVSADGAVDDGPQRGDRSPGGLRPGVRQPGRVEPQAKRASGRHGADAEGAGHGRGDEVHARLYVRLSGFPAGHPAPVRADRLGMLQLRAWGADYVCPGVRGDLVRGAAQPAAAGDRHRGHLSGQWRGRATI